MKFSMRLPTLLDFNQQPFYSLKRGGSDKNHGSPRHMEFSKKTLPGFETIQIIAQGKEAEGASGPHSSCTVQMRVVVRDLFNFQPILMVKGSNVFPASPALHSSNKMQQKHDIEAYNKAQKVSPQCCSRLWMYLAPCENGGVPRQCRHRSVCGPRTQRKRLQHKVKKAKTSSKVKSSQRHGTDNERTVAHESLGLGCHPYIESGSCWLK